MEAKGKKNTVVKKIKRKETTASVLAISQASRLIALMVNHLKETKVPSYLYFDNIIFYPLNALQDKNLHSMWKTCLCPFIYWKYSEGIFKLGGS